MTLSNNEAPISGLVSDSDWDVVPFGVSVESGIVTSWLLSDNPHMLVVGGENSGKTMFQKTVFAHCLKHSKRLYVVGVKEKESHLPFLDDFPETCLFVSDNLDTTIELLEDTRGLMEQLLMARASGENLAEVPTTIIMIDDLDILVGKDGTRTDEKREYIAFLLNEFLRDGHRANIVVVAASHSGVAVDSSLNFDNHVLMGNLDDDDELVRLFGEDDFEQARSLMSSGLGSGVSQVAGSLISFQGFLTSDADLKRFSKKK